MCFAAGKGQDALRLWKAGETVSASDVENFGLERCFATEKLNDVTFAQMKGKSYKANCTVPRSQLRYVKVLHYNAKGDITLGEIVCNQAIANDLVNIFRELFKAKYVIGRMVLIDNYDADDELSMANNNSSCFNFRYATGSKTLSKHSSGMAIDINPLYNPYVKKRKSGTIHIEPSNGKPYANRTKDFPHKISHDDLAYKLFKKYGFRWGGDWHSVKDYQHFEK